MERADRYAAGRYYRAPAAAGLEQKNAEQRNATCFRVHRLTWLAFVVPFCGAASLPFRVLRRPFPRRPAPDAEVAAKPQRRWRGRIPFEGDKGRPTTFG
ncbi:hypothetical protein Rcae01_00477 [Novipirellula caenicola]|uniref:Uncharacterized protein n=1 Tax=Novipirellula caenicola TaxID=1536901 RepID=A0ABP9VIL6_9BACT